MTLQNAKQKTNPIRNTSTHTRNEHDASSVTKPNHLPSNRLSSHECTRDIDTHHLVTVFCCVVQGWRLLLDARSGDQTIQALVLICDFLHDGIQGIDLTDIDAPVGKRGPQLLGRAGLHPCEI
jgi:hypothetical protein